MCRLSCLTCYHLPLHGKSYCSFPPSNIVPMPMNVEWIHLYEWFLVAAIRAQCETRIPDFVTAGTINSNRATGICLLIRRFRSYLGRRQWNKRYAKPLVLNMFVWVLRFCSWSHWLTCNRNSSISIEPCIVRRQSHLCWPHCTERQSRAHPVQSKVPFSMLMFHQLVEKLA